MPMLTEQDLKLIKDRAFQKGRWSALEELLKAIEGPLASEAESMRYNRSPLVIKLEKLMNDYRHQIVMEKKRMGL